MTSRITITNIELREHLKLCFLIILSTSTENVIKSKSFSSDILIATVYLLLCTIQHDSSPATESMKITIDSKSQFGALMKSEIICGGVVGLG